MQTVMGHFRRAFGRSTTGDFAKTVRQLSALTEAAKRAVGVPEQRRRGCAIEAGRGCRHVSCRIEEGPDDWQLASWDTKRRRQLGTPLQPPSVPVSGPGNSLRGLDEAVALHGPGMLL